MGDEVGSLREGALRAIGEVGLHESGGVSFGGAAPELPEFSALEESGGIGTRKAEPIKLCHAVSHPPRRSGCFLKSFAEIMRQPSLQQSKNGFGDLSPLV